MQPIFIAGLTLLSAASIAIRSIEVYPDSCYIVIVNTDTDSSRLARSDVISQLPASPSIVRTDQFSGLKEGLFVLVAAVCNSKNEAIQKCLSLKKANIPAYWKNIGIRNKPNTSILVNAEKKLRTEYGIRLKNIEYKTVLRKSGHQYPFFIVSIGDSSSNRLSDTCTDLRIESVVFTDSSFNRIRSAHFGVPCTSSGEAMEREPIRQYPLSRLDELPTTIAQLSIINNQVRFDFEVLDSTNILNPYCDSTICRFFDSSNPDNSIFAPNDLSIPEGPCDISEYKGDGCTLIEGIEWKGKTKDNLGRWLSYGTRSFRLVWEHGKAIKKNGEWQYDE